MAPLRRKPKQLTEEPTAFSVSGSGAGTVLRGSRSRSRTPDATQKGTNAAETDEQGEQIPLDQEGGTTADPQTRLLAQRIARRLSVARPRRDVRPRRGVGDLASLRWRGGSDDVDLDRTIEVLAENPLPEDEDIVVRERLKRRRSVVLVVDVSGSMKGERVRTAAATVGALAAELARDRLGTVAFWSDAAVLVGLDETVEPATVLDLLLRIPAQGLTNVGFGLDLARRQLAGVSPTQSRVLLLSDCVHNAGPDPRLLAARLPRLDVLLDVSGEHDTELGRDLARAGRGRIRTIRDYRDVAPALNAFLGN
ncbi:VWA domain-containing protein [Aldersonia sp. NBC_00410]|uniref:vWA domain-containing protein n=1 Tax=Aldersonia sp. NBC_00410 TaxID=2975954 RepID=UPI00224C8064|nr:VWA domain-containing protein [Aldersonia sp. NBC_00410]MCX5046529.1 VWA domain-containing protein [Aldersonia sp. NBC_00410]